jgi:hypothetical protein
MLENEKKRKREMLAEE